MEVPRQDDEADSQHNQPSGKVELNDFRCKEMGKPHVERSVNMLNLVLPSVPGLSNVEAVNQLHSIGPGK